MAEAEAADETDQTPASPPGLGFSSPALHAAAAAQVAVIAAHGDDLEDGAGELQSGDALQLELDADEEGGPRGNGGDADQVGADTEPAALDGGDCAVLCFGSPPSSPSPAIVLGGEESSAVSSNASSPQADPGLGTIGLAGLASPSKPPGVIHRTKLGLGLVLHLKGDQEEGAAHHRDTKEEEMVHKCSDANWSTTDEASALEGQVEEESTVGEINAERGATVDDTDAKGQQLVDQDTSDQCKQTDEDIDVGEELVLEGGLGDKWGPTNNALTVEDWEKPVKQDECAANGDDIALEGQEKEAEQCTSDELGATMDDSAVEDQVMVELEGAIDKQGATKDGITVEDQEKTVRQCTSGELGATMDDNVVEDQETGEPEGAVHKQGDISLEDKEKAMEQCAGDKSSTTNDENAVEEKEKVVEQEDTLDKQVTIKDGNAVEYQEEVVEQGVIGKQSAIGDDIAHDDQEKMVQQCTSDDLRSTMDDNAVGDQEVVEQDVIDGRGGATDGIVVEDQEKVVEQCATDELGATENGDAVEDQEVAEQGVITEMGETTYDIAVEDKEKAMEQCTTDELGATESDDAVEDQEVAEQGVITEMGATMVDNVVEDHEVVEQSVIDEMGGTTDAIAVEDQEKAVEQCAVHESRAAKDENAVEEKEKVVEQGVIDCLGAMPVDDIAAEDQEKAVEQYFSDELVTNKDENAVEEHKKVAEQGVIDGSGGTKDDIDVEEQENVKEQGIIDKWDTVNDGTTLEDQKKVAELCIGDEQRAVKDVVAVRNQENMLQQSISDERGATKGEFTVENREVVERVRHEWGATEDDLAVDTAASGGVSGISSSEVVSVSINGSDGETVKEEKVKPCVRYPQRPGKLNCPFYMSTGCYSYGLSCHFNHPPLKANSDVSSVPSEQGNHGVAEILELNRVGLPIREGARNCTYYMRNGTCRYGKKCHYNHPEQVIDAQFYPPTGWEDNVLPYSPHLKKSSDHATLDDTSYLKKSSDDATLDDTSYSKRSSDHATLDGTSYSKKSSDHATLDNTSSSSEVLPPNILRMLLPPQKVPPSTEGKVMKVKKDPDWSSASDDSDGCCSADSSDGPLCKQEHVDYPERPGRPECPFYMRFGDCKFASACKYHHSKDRFPCRYHSKDPLLGEEPIEYPERPGEPECPFYMKSRFCKFGAECKFHHPKDLTPSRRSPTTTKNSVAAANEHHPAIRITPKDHICQQQQHPERPGQPDCGYYMQFGKCKYLSACIFHHPKDRLPSGWHPSDPAHSDQYDTWQPTNRIEDLLQQAQIGPEIPGMPECPFYMKTGTCRFGSACKFRHPKDRCSTTEEAIDQGTDLAYDNFTRSDNVPQQQEQTMYPERPGEPECSYYMRHGSCKFQMNCKYHHPRDRLSKKPYDSGTYH